MNQYTPNSLCEHTAQMAPPISSDGLMELQKLRKEIKRIRKILEQRESPDYGDGVLGLQPEFWEELGIPFRAKRKRRK